MPSSCFGGYQARARRSKSADRQKSPETTRMNSSTANIIETSVVAADRGAGSSTVLCHRKHLLWPPIEAPGRLTLRGRRRSRRRSSIVAADERSIKNQNKDYRHPYIRQEQDNQPHVSSIGEGVGVGGGGHGLLLTMKEK